MLEVGRRGDRHVRKDLGRRVDEGGMDLFVESAVDNKAAHTTFMLSTVTTEKLDKQLKRSLDLESLGIKETDPCSFD